MTTTHDCTGADWDLEVLVSASCASCWHSLTLLAQLAASHPEVRVRVTDVDEPGWVSPPGFVGTPMFLAGGRVLSLGNPTVEALRAVFGLEEHGPARR
jgi:hypothetical protein